MDRLADIDRSTVVVTGAAGFIGAHVARALLKRGRRVVGIDNLNAYYPPALKRARLKPLIVHEGFVFHEADIADFDRLKSLPGVADADLVIHLAAQAGVRYSLEDPFAYARSNLLGHLSILELARHSAKRPLLVYASSSSVYGANTKTPFAETDPVNDPVSLYAATKRSGELMSESYARLYGVAQIGLRFFTVYGPFGRPDMAYWTFTETILAGKPIKVFNNGDMKRDFTYIDDVVAGILAVETTPMKPDRPVPHRNYNIGNSKPVALMRFIGTIEKAVGREAVKIFEPMQPGDVQATCADIDAISADYGFAPTTPLEAGIAKFTTWYREYRKTAGAAPTP